MRVIPLQSSQIQALAYDPTAEDLFVLFRSNQWYRYNGVPNETVLAVLFDTDSHGRAFNKLVKSADYPSSQIRPEDYSLHV